ncbi:MAG: efflux RND transporter periplasmic adaptor subunit [Proteobacteria bacterium]|nr:efflux RND transporter periplasmic adaptor subunit [Pseudomonadota bacterium]
MAIRRRRRAIGVGIVAIVAAFLVYRLVAPQGAHKAAATPPVLIEATAATLRDVPVTLDALGTVVAYRTVTVQPMITGPLLKVLFHEGQFVAKGALLAEIDPRPYQAALAQAQAKLAQDQATLVNAQLQARQYASLVKQNYTSKQQAAAAEATALEDAALVKQDQAAIETDRINLGYTTIRAPIAGKTGILQVNAGNIVTPSLTSGIVTINTLQPISVQFSLPQQDLPALLAAAKAGPVALEATAQGQGEGNAATAPVLDHGVMSVLDNAVNASTGTLTLKGRFPNPQLDLWPGAFVNIVVEVRTIAGALTVPPVAVQQGPQGSFVYLVKPGAKADDDPTVVMQPVTVGYANATTTVITKGLAAGQQVVTEGSAQLREGSRVKVMAAPAPAAPKTTPAPAAPKAAPAPT